MKKLQEQGKPTVDRMKTANYSDDVHFLGIKSSKETLKLHFYKTAVGLEKDNYPSIFNMACCLEKSGKYTAAVKWLKRLIKIENGHMPSYNGLCHNLMRLGRYADAS